MAGLYHGHILEFPRIRVDCFTTGTTNKFIPFPLTIDEPPINEDTKRKHQRIRTSSTLKAGLIQHCTGSTSEYYAPPAAQYHLLTHAHTDHLIGLSSIASSSASGSNVTIICSEETKALVLAYETKKARTTFDREEDSRRGKEAIDEQDKHEEGLEKKDGLVSSEVRVPQRKRSHPSHTHSPRKRPKKLYEGLGPRSLEVVTRSGERQRAWLDCFRTIPYNTVIPLAVPFDNLPRRAGEDDTTAKSSTTATTIVNLVMLDANHCPGSSMFLIYSSKAAVLHTGDVRADSVFLASLKRNPLVQPFLTNSRRRERAFADPNIRRLDRIYLDTSAFIGTTDMLTKEQCIDDLIPLIDAYPSNWIFHINCWTFGYEDVLKAISREFGSLVHLDRWRFDNFKGLGGDPLLLSLGTRDEHVTRFHACESNAPCQAVIDAESRGELVDVNFIEEKVVEHEIKMKVIRAAIHRARQGMDAWPKVLYCPLARHSPLPELQSLVALFRPRSLSPNTLIPGYDGCDYYAMLGAFRDSLDDDSYRNMQAECLAWFRYVRGADWKQKDLYEAYKQTFKIQDNEAWNAGTACEQDDFDNLRRIKEIQREVVLHRSRRANASHQAAVFLTSAISSHTESLEGDSSRSFIKYDDDKVVPDSEKDWKPALIKEESNDNDNEDVRTIDTANASAAHTRQAKSQTRRELDTGDYDRPGRDSVQLVVPAQCSDAVYSPRTAAPNVRMKLRYGSYPAM